MLWGVKIRQYHTLERGEGGGTAGPVLLEKNAITIPTDITNSILHRALGCNCHKFIGKGLYYRGAM